MALQWHIILLFFFLFVKIMISFVACCGSSSLLQEGPPHTYVGDDATYSIDDGGTLKNLDVLRLKSFDYNFGGTSSSRKTINVNDYGAKGDGSTDDAQAFMKAWKEACSSESETVLLVVPQSNYSLKPIRFNGPCNPSIKIQISGTLEASDDPSDYSDDPRHWLKFDNVEKLIVEGGGTIDGNGNIWWKNSCKRNKTLPCKDAPTAVTFYKCRDLMVVNLTIQNAQQIHVSFQGSKNVRVSGLTVTAPADSPNTDGIHVTNTKNIQISSSLIGTGDDCISIVSGSKYVETTDITCGPGHGISIGSLGSGKSRDYVSEITVNGAKLSRTTNGVRIKTWQGGSGSASNIKFQNIQMENVTNPIIIDQNYCDQKKPCKQKTSAVQIRDVLYQNIEGTSASEVAVKFDCSESHPCAGIVMQNIDLKLEGGATPNASCDNVQLSYIGYVSPRCPMHTYTYESRKRSID